MSTPEQRPFLTFLRDGIQQGGFETDDVLAAVLPLMEQVKTAHEQGQVAPLEGVDVLYANETHLWFEDAKLRSPRRSLLRLHQVQKPESRAVEVVGVGRQTTQIDESSHEYENLLVAKQGQEIKRPVFVPGFGCWEHALDHHDELTDIFCLGQLLASLACQLDFSDAKELEAFANSRENLFGLNPRLNPVLASTIVAMTELNRHRRAQDLGSLIQRLRHYRDQTTDFDVTAGKGFREGSLKDRRKIIQSHLRDRLFEISRRNRLIYFRASLQTVNLTLASVPLLLDYRNIRSDQLFTWKDSLAGELSRGTTLNLGSYLRFEDAPYLPGVLDKIISEARRDRTEFGFAQLRLVICFLRWNNLKEVVNERIHSPLLLLPVEVAKKKGVRDVYTLKPTGTEAEVNPALRHHLRQLYGLNLPDSIDLTETSVDAFYDALLKQIQASEPGVSLEKLERPQIQLVHARARQRLDQYRRRLRLSGRGVFSFGEIDYSYQRENFQPLGLQIFLRRVRPSPAPFSDVLREKPMPRSPQIVDSTTGDEAGNVIEAEKQMYAMREGEKDHANPYRWEFDLCSLTLGNFNYRKMSLVRDYSNLLEGDLASAAFDTIFSVEPRATDEPETPLPAIEEQWLVIPCDPTQTSAIARARQGRSYIIQGPPGTGKSQTITNLIADYVARGKRVLFVCEKRAAIDVVYYRLRQQGLDELCCLIHDSQTDKKEFILDLKKTYETFLKGGGADQHAEVKRDELVRAIQQELAILKRFSDAMQTAFETTGVPLRRLLSRLIELRPHEPHLDLLATEQLPEYKLWLAYGDIIRRLADTLRELGEEPLLARQPLRHLNRDVVQVDNPMATLVAHLDNVESVLSQVEAALAKSGLPREMWDAIGQIGELVAFANQVRPLATWKLMELLDPESDRARAFAKHVRELATRVKAVEQAQDKTKGWKQKLPANETATAMAQAESFANSFLSFLKPSFWRLRKIVRERYDFSIHAIRPSEAQMLRELDLEWKAVEAYEGAFRQFQDEFPVDDAQRCLHLVNELQASLPGLQPSAKHLQRHLTRNPQATQIVHDLVALGEQFLPLDAEMGSFLADHGTRSLSALREDLRQIRSSLSLLPDLIPLLRELGQVPENFARVVRTMPLTTEQLEAAMAKKSLESLYRNDRLLQTFEGRSLARRLEKLEGHYREWLDANAAAIRSRVRRNFLEHVRISSSPAAQLTPEQKELKRQYATGRRELEHEFGKTMRYRSIRDLANDETGLVIRDLKPIWLMSPLSVSDTIPLDPREFDVVIFDEASQITPEEAIPAVYRSNQVTVVGDEMQLPPTNFFSASRSDEESFLVEDEGTTIEYDLTADSLLTMAARNLPSTLLGWHYRSRYESLISFSNSSFYQGQLFTVPDRHLPPPNLAEIRVVSPDQGGANVEELLRRSISFHFLENGIYEKRRNSSEAEYIAQLVRSLLARDHKMSIGIVAFSEAQQSEIEAALNQLARDDGEFRNRLEAEYEREKEDQFCGLFVKNLENVQGDERDIIILSICYGYDRNKRMLMNFGPINQRGGEKRLNVIFSRARRHMAVVSSIRHFDITNEYNDGASCLRNFLEYSAAVSVGDHVTARRLLSTLTPNREHHALRTETDSVVTEIAGALRARGHVVDMDVGQSDFRCDLAVHAREGGCYDLGVLVDTEETYRTSHVLERYLLRPSVLRAFHWRIELLLTKDWYHDADGVLNRLERAIHGKAPADEPIEPDKEPVEVQKPATEEIQAPAPQQPASQVIEPVESANPVASSPDPNEADDAIAAVEQATSPSSPPSDPVVIPPGEGRYFEFIGGSSRKFWRIHVQGASFAVHYGRIGTHGQNHSKSYATPIEAEREATKLIAEKVAKGYVEKTAPSEAS